jgi:hypothetical protein
MINSGSSKPGSDRRTFLRSVGGVGAAVVGAIAVVWTDSPVAAASQRQGRTWTPAVNAGCCGLATNTPCGGHWDKGNFTCPSGYSKEFWTCCQGGNAVFVCYECKHKESDNTNACYSGELEDYICSNYTFQFVTCF